VVHIIFFIKTTIVCTNQWYCLAGSRKQVIVDYTMKPQVMV